MAFIKYLPQRGGPSRGIVRTRLSKTHISFTSAAAKILGKIKFVELYYDVKTKAIFLKPVEASTNGAMAIITRRTSNKTVAVQGFIKAFGLEKLIGTEYTPTKEDGGILLEPVKKPVSKIPRIVVSSKKPQRPAATKPLTETEIKHARMAAEHKLAEGLQEFYECAGCGATYSVRPRSCRKCHGISFEKINQKPELVSITE